MPATQSQPIDEFTEVELSILAAYVAKNLRSLAQWKTGGRVEGAVLAKQYERARLEKLLSKLYARLNHYHKISGTSLPQPKKLDEVNAPKAKTVAQQTRDERLSSDTKRNKRRN